MNNELQHHGILGMKWGVRRYQNKDGSLTDAGRKRYNVDIEGVSIRMKEAKEKQAAALKEYNKKTFYGTFYDSRANSKLVKAQKNTELIKDELRTEKIKQRLNNETKKSNRRLKLEKKYKSKGMTEEEAAVAAYKRDKTEKILAATAGVTLTAVAAYVAYKHYDKTVDQFIKSGTILSRVTSNDNQSVKDAFYAAFNNTSDSKKYIGLYGDTLSSRGNDIFQKKIRVNQALKVASEKSAVKELDNLINKNPNFRNTLMSDLKKTDRQLIFGGNDKQKNTIKKAIQTLEKGKINSNVYNALNFNLADHNSDTTKKFYQHMLSKGYDVVVDVNDKKLSGYMAKKPLIVFNSKSVSVESVRKLGEKEISKAKSNGDLNIALKLLLPRAAVATTAGVGLSGGIKLSKSKNNDVIVQKYRKQHPNSTLSYTDILRNYYKTI